ncbi:LysR family transcriptional regulator [Amphritea sp. 1_MG-2023]|uniref:LysR family transcriptional regulator n=1 Tax=Amphritea sp. 1_MG-2023 TaxID=3062670 RepID=UPI0026E16774|nr:LysR family transcriptional regulator [Amphritea sp. 1_MG-2023]MDO6564830.1 LysR family transcriptional regulator [Amphritea sp. 1_MG-2023]
MTHKNVIGHIAGADIRMIKIFKAVVKCGGFSAAESELNISRAAISIAMSDLEQRLSLKLCNRGRSGFSLTDEGEQVYLAALSLLSSHQEFQQRINSIHSELKGDLAIGITDCLITLPRMYITDSLKALKQQAPDVNINIEMVPANQVIKSLLDGQIQIGVAPVFSKNLSLKYVHLYDEESYLYCSHEHPLFHIPENSLQAEHIASHDMVCPSYQHPAEIKKHLKQFNKSARASDREGTAFLILTGCYLGYLPAHFAHPWVEKGLMKPLLKKHFNSLTPYAAIARKDLAPNLILACFMDRLHQLIDSPTAKNNAEIKSA